MTFAEYLLAVVVICAAIGALGFGAACARARWLPTWRGAPARLAEISAVVVVLIVVSQWLGSVGLFRRWVLAVAFVTIGLAMAYVATRAKTRAASSRPDDPSAPADAPLHSAVIATRWATIGAALIALAAVVQWTSHVVAAYASGIYDGDSTWYHLPFATHFGQSGSTFDLLFTSPHSLIPYFPANAETMSGVTLALSGRDLFVPGLSLAWLALALLAGWCIGSRYGGSAVGLAAVAMVMNVPLMAATQAGTARNDIVGVTLLLAAVALIAHARCDPVAFGLAGAVTGVALGVKLSLVPIACILAVCVVVAAPRARRLTITVPWLGAFVVCGAFWYVRNLVQVGNPLPWLGVHLGPLSLPQLHGEETSDSTVLDRLREPGSTGRVLRPGLQLVFGDEWWIFLIVVVGLIVASIAVGRGRTARMFGVVALLALLVYFVLPNGSPSADSPLASVIFALNIRYAFAALALGYVVTVTLPRMNDGRVALGAVVGFAILTALAWTQRSVFDSQSEWLVTGSQRAVAIVIVVALVLVAAAVAIAVHELWPGRRLHGALATAAVLLAVIVGLYVLAVPRIDDRYHDDHRDASAAAWRWAQQLPKTRVAVYGTLFQYPYVGPRLANRVRNLGVERSNGSFRGIRTCRELQQLLADGKYEYVVTALNFGATNGAKLDRVRAWIQAVPGTSTVYDGGREIVYHFTNAPGPDRCP